jgi:hypothetical protein
MNDRNEQLNLDPELRELDERLRREMPVTPPSGLAERIHAATAAHLPAGSRPDDEPRVVVFRIAPMWRYAAAAAVLLAAVVGVWMITLSDGTVTPTDNGSMAAGEGAADATLDDRQLASLAADFEDMAQRMTAKDADGALDANIQTLAAEIEQLALSSGDSYTTRTADDLVSDLAVLESEIASF